MITTEKKRYIDDVIENTKKHITNSEMDYCGLAREFGIVYITDCEECIRGTRINATIGSTTKEYIFIPKHLFASVREFVIAHEFGHALLHHPQEPKKIIEEEANYFAEKLTGRTFPDMLLFLETIILYLKNPVTSIVYSFAEKRLFERLVRKAEGMPY